MKIKHVMLLSSLVALTACSSNPVSDVMEMADTAKSMVMGSSTAYTPVVKPTNTLNESFSIVVGDKTYTTNGKEITDGTNLYKISSQETVTTTQGDKVKVDQRHIKAGDLNIVVDGWSGTSNDNWKATVNGQTGYASNDVSTIDFATLRAKSLQSQMETNMESTKETMTEMKKAVKSKAKQTKSQWMENLP